MAAFDNSTDSMELVRQKGEILVHQGDLVEMVYVIRSGTARVVRMTEAGDEESVIVLKAGQMIGVSALVNRTPQPTTIIAEDELHVVGFQGAQLLSALRS